jgi:hypothetical protein
MTVWSSNTPGRVVREAEWITRTHAVPLQQRSTWPAAVSGERWHLVEFQHHADGAIAHVGLREYPMRSLPGMRILRVLKFGSGVPPAMWGPVLRALRELAMRWARVVRLHVEVCCLDTPESLPDLRAEGANAGYVITAPREYARTRIVSLSDEAARTSGFHRSVMKNVRKTLRAGHTVAAITDERFVPRMRSLLVETMQRTSANVPEVDLDGLVRAARAYPGQFRVSGLFRDGVQEPAHLMAFRWCGSAGSYAEDLLAASTRFEDKEGQVPMMHAIMLDVFEWARDGGARQFDFGGVVTPDSPRYATVGSIARFKQLFGGNEHEVGLDLVYVSRPTLSWFASALSRAAKRFRRKSGAGQ